MMEICVYYKENGQKNSGIITSAFVSAAIVLALVVFVLMQTFEDNQLQYSMSIMNEVSANHAHVVHAYVEASSTKNLSPENTLLFNAKNTLRNINEPTLQYSIEFYILDNNGLVINAIGEELPVGINAFQALQIPVYSGQKSEFFQATRHGKNYHLSLTSMPNEGWTAMALLPSDAINIEVRSSTYFVMTAVGVLIVFCTGFASYFMYVQRKSYATAKDYANKLHQTLNEIPCGIVRCLHDDAWTIVDCTDSLYSIIGISREEMLTTYNNSWLEIIHPDDRAFVKTLLSGADKEVITSEYRILRKKDGSSLYVMDRNRTIKHENEAWLWCVIVDVDDLKKAQVQEQNMVGRYRHLLEMSDNILYEYDIEANQLAVSLEFFKKFEYALPVGDEQNYYVIDNDIIHPEDMDLFMSMQMRIKVGGKVTAALLRIKDNADEWLWCQLRQTAWLDDAGKLKAIGKIDNVDQETRTLQKLQDDVQRDSFTSLYNKVATEELINREVLMNPDARGAFCIIDIDNFKQVNSSFGHAMGDMVIKNLANGLSHIFRSDDIVGRIGGDEFIVYIKKMPNLRPLLLKIDHVQEYFRQTFEDNNVKVSISCSVGIALFPKDGENYAELYRNADKALYRSKMTKDAYNFYDAKIDI